VKKFILVILFGLLLSIGFKSLNNINTIIGEKYPDIVEPSK